MATNSSTPPSSGEKLPCPKAPVKRVRDYEGEDPSFPLKARRVTLDFGFGMSPELKSVDFERLVEFQYGDKTSEF